MLSSWIVEFVHTHTFMMHTPGSTPLRDEGCAEGEPTVGDGVGDVTTRPYDARRDAPPPQRTTRHDERSSETQGIALCAPFYYFSNLEPAAVERLVSPRQQRLYLVPPPL